MTPSVMNPAQGVPMSPRSVRAAIALTAAAATLAVPAPAAATIVSTKGGPTVRYFFPITGGRVDAGSLAGRINHSGGLWFYGLASGKSLKLTHFRIVIGKRPGLTAIVNGDRSTRVRILNLD